MRAVTVPAGYNLHCISTVSRDLLCRLGQIAGKRCTCVEHDERVKKKVKSCCRWPGYAPGPRVWHLSLYIQWSAQCTSPTGDRNPLSPHMNYRRSKWHPSRAPLIKEDLSVSRGLLHIETNMQNKRDTWRYQTRKELDAQIKHLKQG